MSFLRNYLIFIKQASVGEFDLIYDDDFIFVSKFLIFFLFLFLFFKIRSVFKWKRLDGFDSWKMPLLYADHGDYIELKNISPMARKEAYWLERLEQISNTLDARLIEVKKSKRGDRFKIFKDLLPEKHILTFEKERQMTLKIGVNARGEEVKIDLSKNSSVYIDGKPGAGKTILIDTLLKGYINSMGNNIKVIVCTTKPHDYFKYRSNKKIKLYDMSDVEELENNVNGVLGFISDMTKNKKLIESYIENNNINNFENANELSINTSFECNFYLFIFDEAKDYLSKEKSDKKEISEIKTKLIDSVYTHIRRTSRYLSSPVIIASQTQSENDLGIPLKTFSMRFSSHTNEATSRLICGDNRLTDLSFTRGKYFLKTINESHVMRIGIY